MTFAGPIIGVHTGGRVEAAASIGDDVAHASTDRQALEGLLPLVRACLRDVRVEIAQVRAIAVCSGPGSFTGLRIGVAFAKTLAQALGIPALGVSSFDVESSLRAASEGSQPIVVAVEGKRDFYYARIGRDDANGDPIRVSGSREEIRTAAREALGEVTGERELLLAFGDEEPIPGARAAAVATLGLAALAAGDPGDWRSLIIDYGQRPNAVVNWERRHGKS